MVTPGYDGCPVGLSKNILSCFLVEDVYQVMYSQTHMSEHLMIVKLVEDP